MLKRLRGTPLPAWTYLAGRFGATVVTAAASLGLIVTIGVVFFDVTIAWRAARWFLAAAGLGIVTFFLIGVAVTTLVPTTETAAAVPVLRRRQRRPWPAGLSPLRRPLRPRDPAG